MSVTPESMETHLKARSTLTQTVAFDNGSARFEMKIDTVDYKSDKRSVEEFRYIEKYLSTQHFQFKMASDGAISDPSVEDMALQPGSEELNLMKLFMKVQPVLPGSPVKQGDVWERPVEIPSNGRTTTVYKSFSLDDVYLHDGVQMAKIGMNVKYKEIPDSTSDVRMESDGFIVGSGHILFDITHGVITSGSLELSGHLNVHDIVASRVLPNMHVVQKIKLRNGKLSLYEKDSPYILEQGVVLGSTDTFEVEPGVTVLMGEYAKLMLRGPVRILGTEAKPIAFRSADSSESWNGIHFVSSSKPFEVKNLIVENAFRNTVFRARGIFENVKYVNNYYGLWIDDTPEVFLSRCDFTRNRFALSVRAGKVLAADTKVSNNVYGLYLEEGGNYDGDLSLIKDNLEADVRKENDEMSSQGKRVSRNVWQRIETGF